jgi:hypothetical protein
MPLYDFYNSKTKKTTEELMSISDKEKYLAENPHITQAIPSEMHIVSGVMGITHKVDSGFNDVLSKIADHHPASALADKVGKRSIKDAKTNAAVEKWKRKRKFDTTL